MLLVQMQVQTCLEKLKGPIGAGGAAAQGSLARARWASSQCCGGSQSHRAHQQALSQLGRCCAGKPSAGRLGKFLVQAQFQGSVHSSALFLTAAAQNLLCMKLATELGVNIPNPWVMWFKGALVPALLGLLITPLLIFKVRPPEASRAGTACSCRCSAAGWASFGVGTPWTRNQHRAGA